MPFFVCVAIACDIMQWLKIMFSELNISGAVIWMVYVSISGSVGRC